MDAVGADKATTGSQRIVEVVDRPDERPVWISVWGGTNTLAQALWDVRESRSPEALERFVEKLRVFTASWLVYPEAGTHREPVLLSHAGGPYTRMVAPEAEKPETVHVILQLEDQGRPHLFAYRRAVVTVKPRRRSQTLRRSAISTAGD